MKPVVFALFLLSISGSVISLTVPKGHAVFFSPGVSSVGSVKGFEGLRELSNCPNDPNCLIPPDPPDVQVASGPTHVMEMVNLVEAIYLKNGTQIQSSLLGSFFKTGADAISDPKILFDTNSSRWFASILDISSVTVVVAVSRSSDPTAGWKLYSLGVNGPVAPDQPLIGVSGDKFTVTVTYPKIGAGLWIYNKQDLVKLVSSPHVVALGVIKGAEAVFPVQSQSSTATEYLASSGMADTAKNSSLIRVLGVSGQPGVSSVTVSTNVSLAVNLIRQPLGRTVNTDDFRVLSAAWFKGRLWLGLNTSCVLQDNSIVSCVRLIQIDTTTSTISVRQDIDFFAAGQDYFYPAVSLDGIGSLAVVYGYGPQGGVPSLAIVGQALSDPLYTLTPSKTIKVGLATPTQGRYGDYFGASIDPSDATLVWVAGEYVGNGVCQTDPKLYTPCWGTFISSMRVHLGISDSRTFDGYSVRTIGALDVNVASLTVNGTVTVQASGNTTFSRTYNVTGVLLNLQSNGGYRAIFIVNIGVVPRLSSDIEVTLTVGTSAAVNLFVTKTLDINFDGLVDQDDLNLYQGPCYGQPASCDPRLDVNADGTIGILDVSLVAYFNGAIDFR